jgi:hypothetical protein
MCSRQPLTRPIELHDVGQTAFNGSGDLRIASDQNTAIDTDALTVGEREDAEDLQSTNGTEIQLPGQPRRRLRGGEPVAVVPGTLIDFGDELHCTVETAG